MLILKFNDRTTETFDEKIDMFKKIFFLIFSLTNLRDILKSFYLIFIECSLTIIERKIMKTIKRLALDKISSSNDIINQLLKTCVLIMTKFLTSLFKACIQYAYYLKAFKKINIIILKKLEKENYIISKMYYLIILLNIIKRIMKSIISKKIS